MDYSIANRQRLLTNFIVGISILIPVLVAVLMYSAKPAISHNIDLKLLPGFHALLNSMTAICLIFAFIFIRKKNIAAHKTSMLIALLLSVIFLMSYVVYHSLSDETRFGGEGVIRYVYYFILITHIVLAAVIVPFVLFTFLRAFTNNFPAHKKIAKWTLPLWLYVAITGVLVYLLLLPYY